MEDFLVIGSGSIGRRHVQCLKDLGVANVYICEPVEATRKLTEQLYDIRESFAMVEEALERHYDGVMVAVPNHLHAEVACKVIEKKLDLLIEKPIEINLPAARRIQDAVEQHNVICQVAYVFRFDPALSKAYGIVKSGRLGKIYSADLTAGQYLPDWRPGIDYRTNYSAIKAQGGGICLDHSHEFDYFRWFFGEAKEVMSVVDRTSDLEIDVEDIAESLIVCENGMIGRVHLDCLSRAARRHLYVNGSEGMLECDIRSGELRTFIGGSDHWQYWNFGTERNVRYREQLKHFFECVKERKQPLVTAADGVKTLELTLKVRGSSKE